MSMRRILIDLRRDDVEGSVPAKGHVQCVPTRRRDDPESDAIRLPAGFTAPLVDGQVEVLLEPTGPDWCWRITERASRGIVRHVLVPAGDPAPILAYRDLVDVDPATLEPAESAVPAWDAAVAIVGGYASEAAESAGAAHLSETTAAGHAAAAAGFAGAAESARDAAGVYASSAQGNADAAAGSALAAGESRDEAVTARDGSTTAKADAEAARDDAARSATTASTARDEAVAAAETATTKAGAAVSAADRAEAATARTTFEVAPFTLTPVERTTHAGIYAAYDAIMSDHPMYMTSSVLGTTPEGHDVRRYVLAEPADIEVHKLRIGIISGIHGNEKASVAATLRFVQALASPPLGSFSRLRSAAIVEVVPIANPTGYDANTRENGSGVNLNRNFTTGWRETVTGEDPGPGPASEVETQLLEDWLEMGDFDLFFDSHTFLGQPGSSDIITWMRPMGDEGLRHVARGMFAGRVGELSRSWAQRWPDVIPADVTFGRVATHSTPATSVDHAAAIGVPLAYLVETADSLRYDRSRIDLANATASEAFGMAVLDTAEHMITRVPPVAAEVLDTGWTDITSRLPSDKADPVPGHPVLVRRVGPAVQLHGRFASKVTRTLAASLPLTDLLPPGFRMPRDYRVYGSAYVTDPVPRIGMLAANGNNIHTPAVRFPTDSGSYEVGTVVTFGGGWFTNDAAP